MIFISILDNLLLQLIFQDDGLKSGQLMPSMGHAITWTIYVNQRYHKYGDTCPRYIVHSRLRAMFYLLLNSNRTLANELISIRNQASYEAIIQTNVSQEPGPKFNTKMLYRHMNYHCIDNTVVRSSYFHNGIPYAGFIAFIVIRAEFCSR